MLDKNLDFEKLKDLRVGECLELDYKVDGKQLGKIRACKVSENSVKIDFNFGKEKTTLEMNVRRVESG